MGSGKDEVATILTRHGFQRRAFAEGVRKEVYEALKQVAGLGIGAVPPDAPVELQELLCCGCMAEVWAKPTTPTMRRILQLWGTEYRRTQNANYWIDTLADAIRCQLVAISDVRFPEEVQWVRRHGVCWNVIRPSGFYHYADQTLAQHTSETLLQDSQFDDVIVNDGTLDDLARRVEEALKNCALRP